VFVTSKHEHSDERSTFDDRSESRRFIFRDWQRIVSAALAIIYLVIGVLAFRPRSPTDLIATILLMLVGLAFPLAFIWFGDEVGEYAGPLWRPITKTTPGNLVRLGGWMLLLLPVITGLIVWSLQ
jgi:hypothetical protein